MSNIVDQYRITEEPYYRPVADEVELYEAAYSVRMPMMLKGPTGCGKTRFVEYMAHKLNKPLITVACNEDMTASDLVGRFLLSASGTEWQDGPLAIAARHHAVPFVVAAPSSTLDPSTPTGCEIVIEQRAPEEVLVIAGVETAPDDVCVYNPAFDVTPADLVSAIVTDKGVHRAPYSLVE